MTPKLFKKSKDFEEDELISPKVITPETEVPFGLEKEVITKKEQKYLKEEVAEESEEEKLAKRRLTSTPVIIEPPALAKSPTLLKIEGILEQDLQDSYFKMEPDLQKKFKTEGEKTATKIEKILKRTEVKIKKIFKLIFNWLNIIPGVNKFFIKQEAKIKTDKIIKLKQ